MGAGDREDAIFVAHAHFVTAGPLPERWKNEPFGLNHKTLKSHSGGAFTQGDNRMDVTFDAEEVAKLRRIVMAMSTNEGGEMEGPGVELHGAAGERFGRSALVIADEKVEEDPIKTPEE